jgi:nucleoside 2-deoxyribosyltransferase
MEQVMAKKYRIFISFAIEDKSSRDLLVGQAKNEKSPFSFVDMSVKKPWDKEWKTNCRTKIKGCDGVIALVSKNTAKASGALWEVACAKEEKIPIRGIYIDSKNKPSSLPSEFAGVRVVEWKWSNIKSFLDSL